MDVELVAVHRSDRSVLANLVQFYQYDFSEYLGEDVDPHGTFEFRYLDSYFIEPGRERWFVTVGGRLAGFVLLRGDLGDFWNVSEFFVLRKYRRQGVAGAAARLAFARHPGTWTLTFTHANLPAAAFWPALVESVAQGPVQQTVLTGGTVTQLRFLVGQ